MPADEHADLLRADSLVALAHAETIVREGERFVLQTNDADALLDELHARGVVFWDLEIQAATLEEAFLRLTEASS